MATASALRSAFPSLFAGAFATGGEFVADRPALFLAGERGPERVQVSPNQPGVGPPGGGGGGLGTFLNIAGDSSGVDPHEIKRLVAQAYFEVAQSAPGSGASAPIRRGARSNAGYPGQLRAANGGPGLGRLNTTQVPRRL